MKDNMPESRWRETAIIRDVRPAVCLSICESVNSLTIEWQLSEGWLMRVKNTCQCRAQRPRVEHIPAITHVCRACVFIISSLFIYQSICSSTSLKVLRDFGEVFVWASLPLSSIHANCCSSATVWSCSWTNVGVEMWGKKAQSNKVPLTQEGKQVMALHLHFDFTHEMSCSRKYLHESTLTIVINCFL